jgi:predicted CopG family antitoxin
MKTISIDDDVYAHIASRTADIGESASQVLRREMNMGSQLKTVFIEEDVYHYLISKIVHIGESASTILRRELGLSPLGPTPPQPAPTPQPNEPQIVEFHIAAGTGHGPWNTSETRVIAKVGDTLRIWNDDTEPHQPQSDGGTPYSQPEIQHRTCEFSGLSSPLTLPTGPRASTLRSCEWARCRVLARG